MAQLNGLTAQATLPSLSLPSLLSLSTCSPSPSVETTTAEVAHLKAIAPLFLPLKVLHVKCAARYRLGYGYPATRLPKYQDYITTCAPPLAIAKKRTHRERERGKAHTRLVSASGSGTSSAGKRLAEFKIST